MQLVAETMEPVGAGSLQLAFEQLKERLNAEGLFDAARKRPLPAFPRTVAIVTSPTGAVIRDFLSIVARRHSGLNVLIYPVSVQGESAPAKSSPPSPNSTRQISPGQDSQALSELTSSSSPGRRLS